MVFYLIMYLNQKKINSKFHIHVPHMKIAQMRVELDNTESNFNDEKFT